MFTVMGYKYLLLAACTINFILVYGHRGWGNAGNHHHHGTDINKGGVGLNIGGRGWKSVGIGWTGNPQGG